MKEKYDAVLVGAGIMSATLASLLSELEPSWRIAVVERLEKPGLESSGPWHNAGTGHAALCELNYTPRSPDGTVKVDKAENVHRQWITSLSYWARLVRQGKLQSDFIRSMPHMSFVTGEDGVHFLQDRHAAMESSALFKSKLTYSEDPSVISSWAPLLMEDRIGDRVAATRAESGTDVNFGALTESLLKLSKADVTFRCEVKKLKQSRDGSWTVKVQEVDGTRRTMETPFVFVGAGGGTLPLLQKADLKEIRGYGGFPVSGQFWATEKPGAVTQHKAKVYGQAAVGAPPMSVPHLDARWIDGQESLLFGPYAGFSSRFLKHGSLWDLVKAVRWHNIVPLLTVSVNNVPLTWYLIREVLASKTKRYDELLKFYPQAAQEDWRQVIAGQRVQVIRPKGKFGGTLEFGTEVIVKQDGSLAGLLGASPGASTAVAIMLDTLGRAFPDRRSEWAEMLGKDAASWTETSDTELRRLGEQAQVTLGL